MRVNQEIKNKSFERIYDIADCIKEIKTKINMEHDPRLIIDMADTMELLVNSLLYEINKQRKSN